MLSQQKELIIYFLQISIEGSQEIVHEADAKENRQSRFVVDEQKSNEAVKKDTEVATSEVSPSTTPPPPAPSPPTIQPACERIPPVLNELHSVNSTIYDDMEQTSASYTVPGSSGTLKETHIFTPIKPTNVEMELPPSIIPNEQVRNTETMQPSVLHAGFEQSLDKVGIVIKENVVKKEYRDIEYNPEKLKADSMESDDFTEFQSVNPIALHSNTISNNVGSSVSSISIDWPAPGVNTGIDLREFEQLPSSIASNSSNELQENLSTKLSQKMASMTVPENHSQSASRFLSSNDIYESMSKIDGKCDEIQPSSTKGISYISHISAIPAIIPTNNSYAFQLPEIAPNVFEKSPPTLGECSTILTPQVASTNRPLSDRPSNEKPVIAWPEPGINNDELARLEQIFSNPPVQSKPKTENPINNSFQSSSNSNANAVVSNAEDDEWSDFVSVEQPQTPITNILNKNLQKHQSNDDDDWSEFVSSTPSVPQRVQHNSTGPNKLLNASAGANFMSWNAPLQLNAYDNLNKISILPSEAINSYSFSPATFNVPQNNPNVTNQRTFTQNHHQSPSIISVPDMKFVAPKMNMPRTTFTKK